MASGNYRTQDRIIKEAQALAEQLGLKSSDFYFRTSPSPAFNNEHLVFGESYETFSFEQDPQNPLYADLRTDNTHLLFWVQRSQGKQNVIGVVTSDPRVTMRTGNLVHWRVSKDLSQALMGVGIK